MKMKTDAKLEVLYDILIGEEKDSSLAHLRKNFACRKCILQLKRSEIFTGTLVRLSVFKDSNLFCTVCRVHFRANICKFPNEQIVVIHPLHQCSFKASVADFLCKQFCGFFTYEVADYKMFSFYKKHLLSRELLDCWLQKIFGSEVTFRDIFFFWESSCSSQTAQFHATITVRSLKTQNANETL